MAALPAPKGRLFRTAVAVAAALVAVTAVQPAFAKLSSNKLSSNTLAVGSPTGAVNGVSAIVLSGGKTVRR